MVHTDLHPGFGLWSSSYHGCDNCAIRLTPALPSIMSWLLYATKSKVLSEGQRVVLASVTQTRDIKWTSWFHLQITSLFEVESCRITQRLLGSCWVPYIFEKSSVYTSDLGFLGKGPNSSVHPIGPSTRSDLPDVDPRYLMSEVFNTSDWCRQLLPHGFRGIRYISPAQSTCASKCTKDKNICVDLTRVTFINIYLVYIGSI